ncbi:MAG: hypothetical protein ABH824_05050 [Nanoarchaeota archaeon]|nr:hypothetical protein [Nanoarchaeota archaeon]MBU1632467.1 hypothetical protein [Nanoarchaeota archaeon]MBU1876460.1 hypothetical protein [Nanoarchaeota archaeon]
MADNKTMVKAKKKIEKNSFFKNLFFESKKKNKFFAGAYIFIGIFSLILGIFTKHLAFFVVAGLIFILAGTRLLIYLRH